MALVLLAGCGDDDEPMTSNENPVASFQYEIDANDFLSVSFMNFSQNATSYRWDFGDGNSSTDESPSHTYDVAGTYSVELTASNASGTPSVRSETFTLTDPDSALKLLTGESSKTWKLFREGTSLSLGPNADNPAGFWAGLSNDGGRPCSYEQEFIFHRDGTFEFDDKGMFWAEFGVFNNVANCDVSVTDEQCFESTDANMVNACGDDVSAWRSGTHTFDYNTATGDLTLSGLGAWIGIPKLGTSGESITPVNSVTTKVTIEQFTGYDVMLVEFIWADLYWPARYVNYSDPSLEPELVTEQEEFGEVLPEASPTSLAHSFAEAGTSTIDTIPSASKITFGVPDPAGSTDLVGEFLRTTDQFQELKFQTSPEKNDINFENLSTASIEVYFPSSNDYSGTLTKNVIIGLADVSKTEQWWTDLQQFEIEGSAFPEDEWVSISFELNGPTYIAVPDNGTTPYERNDYDMIFLNIGSGDHTDSGTFYVRNLKID